MTASSNGTHAANGTGPSLFKLVHGVAPERRLLLPADALVIIGRQLERIVQEQQLPADVAIGTLRFSLFRLHQGRIGQLAASCRRVTVYGEADVEPPAIPNVEFVALEPGTPLCYEWFLVIDSPVFWGALLTQAVPDRRNGNLRRYLFEGTLTNDERLVSRTHLLLSLVQRRSAPRAGSRDPLANRACWAAVAHTLASHSEAARLALPASLGEFPELLDILAARTLGPEQLLSQALVALLQFAAASGALFYRLEDQRLVPLAWNGVRQPAIVGLGASLAGRALQQGTPLLAALGPGEYEQALLPEARSVAAAPLSLHGRPWGVLLAGQREATPSPAAAAMVVGVAALLELLLAEQLDPAAVQPAAPAKQPAVAPTPPALVVAPTAWPESYEPALGNGVPPVNLAARPPAMLRTAPPPAPTPRTPPPAVPQAGAFGLPSWMRGSSLAVPVASAPLPVPVQRPTTSDPQADRSWATLQKRMMGALVAFDQRAAEYVWSEACSVYTTEAVCTELLIPVQVAIGEGWHRGEVSVGAEHFASRFVEGKLMTILSTQIDGISGPVAVIGCAQHEQHELGPLMLALFMRWSGFRVIYLGQNVPNTTIAETMRQVRPQILGLSATTVEAAHSLTEVGQILARLEPPRPLFIYGGMAFYERPDLRSRIQGQFLEGDVRQIVRQLAEQFRK